MANPLALLAVQRLEASGDLEGALRGFLELGRKDEAARVALRLRRFADAARLYTEAGKPFEAAGAAYQGGDLAGALDQLAYVPRDDPRYRQACVHAIHIAARLDRLDFAVENLLGDFVSGPPADAQELQALVVLVGLYERQGFPENALEAAGRILARDPGHSEALAAKARLERGAQAAAPAIEKVLAEDEAFFRRDRQRPQAATLPPDAIEAARATVLEVGLPATGLGAAGPPTAAPSPANAAPKPVFAGRYRLEAKIGIGGMAEVWHATDLDVGEEIALKIFQPLTDPAAEERIKAELKLTRRLAHPNIVRIYDIGTFDNRRYISMEYLQGRDLQQVPKPVTLADAVTWLSQACEGLHAAHEQGIIHRDVKPENLFLTAQGRVKVMDFGIAKDTEVRRTRAGMMAGTPEFISPEQINDMSLVTYATDLYSIGIVAYELLTGALPFHHKELMPLLMMHVKEPPPPMRSKRPDLPEAVDRVVLRAIAKAPADRYPSTRAFAEALRAAAGYT